MRVLDTSVAAESMRPAPVVAALVAERDTKEMFMTAVSEAELRFGAAIVPAGRRRNQPEAVMARWIEAGSGERILPFASTAAGHFAEVASRRRRPGRPIEAAVCQIAATTCSRGAVPSTHSARDFEKSVVDIVDPWVNAQN
ncbi:MAG: VapC toxin family PIN domain ribonuclease [Albidovulum sp.]|nr:VapC toxin family PIN domain ribonuclease [Albidovulum sp.]